MIIWVTVAQPKYLAVALFLYKPDKLIYLAQILYCVYSWGGGILNAILSLKLGTVKILQNAINLYGTYFGV